MTAIILCHYYDARRMFRRWNSLDLSNATYSWFITLISVLHSLFWIYFTVFSPCFYRVFTMLLPCFYHVFYRVFTTLLPCFYHVFTLFLPCFSYFSRLLRQNEMIANAQRTVAETQDVGIEITNELRRNTEKINASHSKVCKKLHYRKNLWTISTGLYRLLPSFTDEIVT